LRLTDGSSFKQEAERLTVDLESSQGQAAQLEAHVTMLTEERDSLHSKLEMLTQEYAEQALHLDGLREQGQRFLSSGDDMSEQLAEREEDVRALEARLDEALQAAEAARADFAREQLARDRVEASLAAARRSHDMLSEENRHLKVQARMQALEMVQSQEEAVAAREVEARDTAASDACIRELEAQVNQLHATAAQEQLVAQEAEARAAASDARVQELEAQVDHLLKLQERAAKADATATSEREQFLQAELDALRIKAAQFDSMQNQEGASNGLAPLRSQIDELWQQNQGLQVAFEQAQAELAQQTEAKVAAEMQASQARGALVTAELTVEKLQKERDELLASAGQQLPQEEVQDMARRAGELQEKLTSALDEKRTLAAELARLKGDAVSQERAAAVTRSQHLEVLKQVADAQATIMELTGQQRDMQAKADEQARDLLLRLERSEKEAAKARARVSKTAEERDQARRELREERQVALKSSAQTQEYLHGARQRELQATARSQNLDEEVAKLRTRCESLVQEVLAARSSVVVSEPAPGQVFLQDPTCGSCLIQSAPAVPVTAPLNTMFPYRTKLSDALALEHHRVLVPGPPVVTRSVKHLGTTVHVIGNAPPQPVPTTVTTAPASPLLASSRTPLVSVHGSLPTSPGGPTSPLSTSIGPSGPISPVPTGAGVAPMTAGTLAPKSVIVRPGALVPTSVKLSPPRTLVAAPQPSPGTVLWTVGAPKVTGSVDVQVLGVRRIQR